jgi:hypothetical protein
MRIVLPGLLHGVLAAGLLGGSYAYAACSSATDQTMFDVAALKSEMMVLAMGCPGSDGDYNAFINKFKPQLAANEQVLTAYFKRVYGRNGQREHDAYVTNLANSQSQLGSRQGSEFCPRNTVIFKEAMALPSGNELPQYAAAKDLVPEGLDGCTASASASPAPATRTRTASHGKKH